MCIPATYICRYWYIYRETEHDTHTINVWTLLSSYIYIPDEVPSSCLCNIHVPRHIKHDLVWTRGQAYVTKTATGLCGPICLLAGIGAGTSGGRALFRNIDLQYIRNSVARFSERTYASGFASWTKIRRLVEGTSTLSRTRTRKSMSLP